MAVKREVLSVVDELPKADQARAYGLAVACCRKLDEREEGLDYLAKGEALGVRQTRARVELLAQGAALFVHVGDVEQARSYVERSMRMVDEELSKPEKSSRWSKERRKWFVKAKVRNLVLRGELTFRLKDRPGREALQDAFDAIERAGGFLHEQVCGVSLVCQLLAYHGGFREVCAGLRLSYEVEKNLKRKRYPRSHPYRLMIRWSRSVSLARLGMDERAETTMREVAETFIRKGITAEAKMAVETLLWIVGERSGEIGRARLLARKYGEAIPGIEMPAFPKPVKKGSVEW